MQSRGILAVIDGHYYAYRLFFGMPGLTGPGKRPTGASYGFAKLLSDLRDDPAITHWAAVFDHADPSFRHLIFPDYKAHRDPMPEDLRMQLPDIEAICRANGIPLIHAAGFEADDAVATLAKTAAAAGLEVRMLTKDKDVDQVLSDRISTWDPGKKLIRGPKELLDEKGIRPEQVIDYLCLIGDSADNVPGAVGVGPVKAAKLLAEHQTMEASLAAADGIKGKLGENLRAFREKAELTRKLITLVDVPGLPAIDQLALDRERPIDPAPYEALGFQLARFQPAKTIPASAKGVYQVVASSDELPAIVAAIRASGRCALDTETTGLDPLTARIVGVSLAWGAHDGHGACYIPVAGTGAPLLPWDAVHAALAPLLADPAVAKVGQNIKYDWQILKMHGIAVAGYDGDTMLASWLLDPARQGHGLDDLAVHFLGETKIPTTDVVDLASGATMAQSPVAAVARYACEDAQVCWRLAQLLEGRLREAGLDGVYRTLEVPTALAIAGMELSGIACDTAALKATRDHLQAYLDQVLAELRRIAGPAFNPASPKQVADLLFTRLKLPAGDGKGPPSTEAHVLEALRRHHEAPHLILQHRQLAKLINTYLDKLPEHVNAVDGRIHAHFRQTGTETGRMSCDQPNLQNIPKKSDLGREIRGAFSAGSGQVLIAADYSQIELRVLAHLSGDPALIEAFHAGADIHRRCAALVHGVPEDQVSPAQRSAAKAVNFGIIYGQTAFGLSQQLGIAKGEAQAFIDAYFARFATVQSWIAGVIARAAADGFARTMAGRRRSVPLLSSQNRNERLQGERIALNSTVQGSAADLIKRAMVRLGPALPPGARLLLQIHDELVVECDEASAPAAAAALTAAMRGAADLAGPDGLRVPLTADARIGRSWLDVS